MTLGYGFCGQLQPGTGTSRAPAHRRPVRRTRARRRLLSALLSGICSALSETVASQRASPSGQPRLRQRKGESQAASHARGQPRLSRAKARHSHGRLPRPLRAHVLRHGPRNGQDPDTGARDRAHRERTKGPGLHEDARGPSNKSDDEEPAVQPSTKTLEELRLQRRTATGVLPKSMEEHNIEKEVQEDGKVYRNARACTGGDLKMRYPGPHDRPKKDDIIPHYDTHQDKTCEGVWPKVCFQ